MMDNEARRQIRELKEIVDRLMDLLPGRLQFLPPFHTDRAHGTGMTVSLDQTVLQNDLAAGGINDHLVIVSADDTKPDTLENKLTSNDGSVTFAEVNEGGNEKLSLVAAAGPPGPAGPAAIVPIFRDEEQEHYWFPPSSTLYNFLLGTTGTDLNWAISGTTATLNVPNASGTARGVVSIIAQTFKGFKTFTDGIEVGLTGSPSLYSTYAGSFPQLQINQFNGAGTLTWTGAFGGPTTAAGSSNALVLFTAGPGASATHQLYMDGTTLRLINSSDGASFPVYSIAHGSGATRLDGVSGTDPIGNVFTGGIVTTRATTTPVADGTYTVGAALNPGVGVTGQITTQNGIITAVRQAT